MRPKERGAPEPPVGLTEILAAGHLPPGGAGLGCDVVPRDRGALGGGNGSFGAPRMILSAVAAGRRGAAAVPAIFPGTRPQPRAVRVALIYGRRGQGIGPEVIVESG